jgi:hypothetical protein
MATEEERKKWAEQAAAMDKDNKLWKKRFMALATEMFGKTKWELTPGELEVLVEEYNKRYSSLLSVSEMSGVNQSLARLIETLARNDEAVRRLKEDFG